MNTTIIKILLASLMTISTLFTQCSSVPVNENQKIEEVSNENQEEVNDELEEKILKQQEQIEQLQEQLKSQQEQTDTQQNKQEQISTQQSQQEQTNTEQNEEVIVSESTPLEIQYDLNPFQLENAPLLILNSPIDGSAIPTNTYTIEQMAQMVEDINGIEKHRLTFVGYVINDDCTRAYGLFVVDKNTSAELIPMVVAHEVINVVTGEVVDTTNVLEVNINNNQIYIDGEPVPDTLFNDVSSVYSMSYVRMILGQ